MHRVCGDDEKKSKLVRWFHLLAGSVQPATCLSNALGLLRHYLYLFTYLYLFNTKMNL